MRREPAAGQRKPEGAGLGLRQRLVLGTALATTAFMGGYRGYVRRAYAACTGPVGGPYLCSGTLTTTQTLTGTPLTVTTAPGFSINTAAGNAFTLKGTGGLAFTDSNSSSIAGQDFGLFANNYGAGELVITATGAITATNRGGILARNNNAIGTNLTINAAQVTGGSYGIATNNGGAGALAVTTTGTVTGLGGIGIGLTNANPLGTDLTVDAADVHGASDGINARNYGTGILRISATGAVTGTTNYGIYAKNLNVASTSLTINAVDVSGGNYGILAHNYGTGALSITTTGTVAGTTNDGIFAQNQGAGLTIDARAVTGGTNGIYARAYGSGALVITSTGTVTGTGRNGIDARDTAGSGLTIDAAAVSGARYGIQARHDGSGAMAITATGAVTGGSRRGINAYAGNAATDLTVDAAAVTGGTDGIIAVSGGSGALAVTATGTVTGTSGFGIGAASFAGNGLTIDAAAVTGGYYGIAAFHNGTGALSITTTGAVTGTTGGGIYGYADTSTTGMAITATDVSGGRNGIYALHFGGGALAIAATGTVIGTTGFGVNASDTAAATGMKIDAEAVRGGTYGIFARHRGTGVLDIAATRTVTGANKRGIDAYAGAAASGLTLHAAAVNGATDGILADHAGTGALSITSTGAVTGTAGFGIDALDTSRATGLSIDAASVNGGTDGIRARHLGSGGLAVTATGAVTGKSDTGIYAFADTGATGVAIRATDASGGKSGIVARHQGSGALSIISTGTLIGTADIGVDALDTVHAADLAIDTAAVNGGTDGIHARHLGSGGLAITATGAATGKSDAGIYAFADQGATGTTIKVADVSGGKDGIFARHLGSGGLAITATGNVTGKGDTGIYAINGSAAAGSTTTAKLTHGAEARGAKFGVRLTSATNRAATLENAGTIVGATAVDVHGSPVTISNAGAITGALGVHVTGGPATLTSTGDITGTGGTAIDLRAATGQNTVNIAAGTITGDILLSAGADTVDVTGGAIKGDIAGKGKAALDFALGTGSFTFGAPFAISGIDQVTMNSGTVEIDGKLSAGTLVVNGGRMILDGSSNLTGGSTVQGGIFSVNGRLRSDVDVLAGGRLQGTGTISGTAENFTGGTVAPGNSIGTLTINGDYIGSGGTLEIEAVLGGDASPADRLVVTGDTSGSTNVRVINLGGTGAATVEGIKVVDVGGASNGTFTLLGNVVSAGQPAVVAGVYAYTLEQNGIATPADGDWYLRSRLAPNVPLYEAYPGVLQSLNQPGTLQQRLGNRSWTIEAQGADAPSDEVETAAGLGTWARIEGAHGEFEPETSTTGTNYDASIWKLESGLDMPIYEQEAGRLIGGVAFRYGHVSSDVESGLGRGSIDATGYGVTGTLTWYGKTGFYLDGQANVTWYDSDIAADALGTLASGNDGTGYSLSVEAGQRVPLDQRWSLTPQAQLAWSSVDFDDFTDPFGAKVSLGDGNSLVGRLGLSADYENSWTDAAGETSRTHLYGIANLYYDFEAQYDVAVSGVSLVSKTQPLWGGLGIGGSLDWANGKYSLYGEALARTSLEDFGDSHVLSGTVGFRVNW